MVISDKGLPHPRALQFAGNVRNGATNMFHAITALAERDLHQDPNARYNLNAILAFDVKNAFNTVSRKHILSLLKKGCSKILGLSSVQPRITSNKPMGWDVLWPHVLAHYGGRGLLKYYHEAKLRKSAASLVFIKGVHWAALCLLLPSIQSSLRLRKLFSFLRTLTTWL